ncbi:MAG: peptidoglycan-binding domain-containing protein [Janthinobacterium lividum]
MKRPNFLVAVAAGLITTMPALAEPASAAASASQRTVGSLHLDAARMKSLQTTLDQKGFSPGQIDGLWGPNTAAALKRFQATKGLQASGRFDQATLDALGGTSAVLAPGAAAQADSTAPASTASKMATGGEIPGIGAGSGSGVAAASGNDNQAIATTNANALQPAHGANSFSKGEAERRIVRHGFQDVSDLHKDGAGVWRATASKEGQHVQVWLDYKGNVGQQS